MKFPFFKKKCSGVERSIILLRKPSFEGFVNAVDHEDENVGDYYCSGGDVSGGRDDNVAYMTRIRNRTLSKTCRVCINDNQQEHSEKCFLKTLNSTGVYFRPYNLKKKK